MSAPINPEDISHQVDLGRAQAPYGNGDVMTAFINIDHKGKPTVYVTTYGTGKKSSTISFIGHSGTRAFLAFIGMAQEKIEYILNHKPAVETESKPANVINAEPLSAPSES